MTEKPASSISATARHLDLSRERLRQLEAEGVIAQEPGGGFDLDQTRLRYIRFLRDRPARSAKHDALHDARAALTQMRLRKLANELVLRVEFDAAWDAVIGVLLVHLNGVPPRAAGRDLDLRRRIHDEINVARAAAAGEYRRQAAALETTGRAAP